MSSMLRSMARERAKENMRKKGMRQFCKHDYSQNYKGMTIRIGSYFSENWRKYTDMVIIDARRKKGVTA